MSAATDTARLLGIVQDAQLKVGGDAKPRCRQSCRRPTQPPACCCPSVALPLHRLWAARPTCPLFSNMLPDIFDTPCLLTLWVQLTQLEATARGLLDELAASAAATPRLRELLAAGDRLVAAVQVRSSVTSGWRPDLLCSGAGQAKLCGCSWRSAQACCPAAVVCPLPVQTAGSELGPRLPAGVALPAAPNHAAVGALAGTGACRPRGRAASCR